jgi:hypothetical protein
MSRPYDCAVSYPISQYVHFEESLAMISGPSTREMNVLGSRRVVIVLVVLISSLLTAHVCDAVETKHLYVFMIGDTEDESIGKSVSADVENLKRTLEYGIPECRRTIASISGEQATPTGVLTRLQKLDVSPDASLFVYYSGHGIVDPELGHVLTMKRGNLARKELFEAMRAKNSRLTILITDCCAVYSRAISVPKALPGGWDVFRSLFFLHQGEVNLNAAKTGTYAFCDPRGGVFTQSLCFALRVRRDPRVVSAGRVVNWQDFVSEVKVTANKAAKTRLNLNQWDVVGRGVRVLSRKELETSMQEPEVFGRLAVPSEEFLPRSGLPLGISIEASGDQGVKIKGVKEKSPAEWAGLCMGDQIVALNQQPVRTREDFHREVAKSSKQQHAMGSSSLLKIMRAGSPSPIEVRLWLEK